MKTYPDCFSIFLWHFRKERLFFRSIRVLQVSIQKQLEAFALQVSFVLASHGITVLWGASGSGKTTLLQCLAGLLRPDAGRIACREAVWFDAERGVCLAPERRRLGYVFQDVRLFPHLSVRSNMLFGRRFRGPSGVSFEDVVALLGLGRLLHRTPSDLSGGEKQRVAVGRALLACPELLLMDEPLTGLDRGKREEIMAYVKAIPERFDVPILYVTHSDAELRFLADRVLNLEDGKLAED